jgi:ubiquinone/menaquinone biosynthesis C-methylase UbiE
MADQTDYREDVAEFYDHITQYRERQDVDFFVDHARESGGPVLELGCGTGRVLIPTARAGIEILGLDLSTSMLEQCRKKLALEAPEVRDRVKLVQGDMRDFNIKKSFKLVTIPFRPFQHLATVSDQMMCLSNVHCHLETGGRLVFDLFNPLLESLVDETAFDETVDGPQFRMDDGRTVQRFHRVTSRDLFTQALEVDLIYQVIHSDGRVERITHPITMRYSFRYEVEHLLARCGFEVESVYSDYEKRPFGAKYPGDLIFVAKKSAEC